MRTIAEFFATPSATLALIAVLVGLGQVVMGYNRRPVRWLAFFLQSLCGIVLTAAFLTFGWEHRDSIEKIFGLEAYAWLALAPGLVWFGASSLLLVRGIRKDNLLKELRRLFKEGLKINNSWEDNKGWSARWNAWQAEVTGIYRKMSPSLADDMEIILDDSVPLFDVTQAFTDQKVIYKKLKDLRSYLHKNHVVP